MLFAGRPKQKQEPKLRNFKSNTPDSSPGSKYSKRPLLGRVRTKLASAVFKLADGSISLTFWLVSLGVRIDPRAVRLAETLPRSASHG